MTMGTSSIPTSLHCISVIPKCPCDNFFFTLAYLIPVALNQICLSEPGKNENFRKWMANDEEESCWIAACNLSCSNTQALLYRTPEWWFSSNVYGWFFFLCGISEKYLSVLMIYFGDTGAFILYNRNEDLRKWQVFWNESLENPQVCRTCSGCGQWYPAS